MKIQLVTPAGKYSRRGNRITAERWENILKNLGHEPLVLEAWDPEQPAELLIALHAKKSARSIADYRRARPDAPLVVVLTGTDLYADLIADAAAQRSLELATRLIVLQERGIEALPAHVRAKARTIHQSCPPPQGIKRLAPDRFVVCVLGHLRPVKDPFRAAYAARLAPPASRLLVVQLGAALEPEMAEEAEREMAINPRYRWLGEVEREEAMSILAGSELCALTSELEGGANAISEAIAAGVAVVSSRIEGSIGLLGDDHPAYFPVHDTRALAELFERAECEPAFLAELRRRSSSRKALIDPAREHEAWRRLLGELHPR